MNTTIFERIKLLPPEKQQQLEDFIEFLYEKYGKKEEPDENKRSYKNHFTNCKK